MIIIYIYSIYHIVEGVPVVATKGIVVAQARGC
jgi:hypothetical protein